MAETWRLFIALELPPELTEYLQTIQDQLKQQTPDRVVRWVRPEGIHLTLKFLGDVPVIKRDTLERELAKAVKDHDAFTLNAGGLGCFPNPNRPRVAWVGIQGDQDALAALHAAVEKHIAPLGFPTENRRFNPHLTLGRVRREASRNAAQSLGQLITDTTLKPSRSWTITSVTLFRSELKPGGAVYTQLFHAPLHNPNTPDSTSKSC